MRRNKGEEKQAKELAEFLNWASQRNAVEFAGIAHLLGVRLVENVEVADESIGGAPVKVRPFDKVIEDMIEKYLSMNRDQHRALKKLMREVKKEDFLYGRD